MDEEREAIDTYFVAEDLSMMGAEVGGFEREQKLMHI